METTLEKATGYRGRRHMPAPSCEACLLGLRRIEQVRYCSFEAHG
jgi:hypothetical protein